MGFRKRAMVAGVMIVASGVAHGAEGMWVPQQLPEIAGALKEAGLQLDPHQLADLTDGPLGAVVTLGGCTGSFVSPRGLVMTNHHCAQWAIQANSTPTKNLLKDGFAAGADGDELPVGPAGRVYPLESIHEVTTEVREAVATESDGLARTRALEEVQKRLVAQCESAGGYYCRVYSFDGGNAYRLFRYIEIKDVRLAYAPPEAIAQFGGQVDNWMWPRHGADFTFYRAYVGKDGKPATYSKDNVPYRPRQWLRLSDNPLHAGDFVMVAGFPGQTSRYALANELEETADWAYPVASRHYRNMVDLIEKAGRKNPDVAVKYTSLQYGLLNAAKLYEGQLEGFKRSGALARKREQEAALLGWLGEQGADGKAALAAHGKLEAINREASEDRERRFILEWFHFRNGPIGVAVELYRQVIEREKPDAEREPRFQERDRQRREGSLRQLDGFYHADVDAQLQAYWLREYLKLPKAQRVPAIEALLDGEDESAVQQAVDRLAKSRLGSVDERLKWHAADRAAFEASDDPAIRYAVAVMPALLELERASKSRDGETLASRPVYLRALADQNRKSGRFIYPDANGSLRITFGKVTGYTKPDGSRQSEFTRLEEVPPKATGVAPFDAPKSLLDAIAARRHGGLADEALGTVPVNFLSDLDITGGNSGSPVLDAHGKLVGLAFDCNWESVSSNWVFDPASNRTISVDARYMRWIMQEAYPAPALLSELGVGGGHAAAASAR